MSRPKMLEVPVTTYAYETSEYPEQLRISFDDGHTAIYELRIEQPKPQFIESIRIIRKWTGYQPKRRRRSRG